MHIFNRYLANVGSSCATHSTVDVFKVRSVCCQSASFQQRINDIIGVVETWDTDALSPDLIVCHASMSLPSNGEGTTSYKWCISSVRRLLDKVTRCAFASLFDIQVCVHSRACFDQRMCALASMLWPTQQSCWEICDVNCNIYADGSNWRWSHKGPWYSGCLNLQDCYFAKCPCCSLSSASVCSFDPYPYAPYVW